MKKRTIISLLLVACMATMCFVGGTFAKYASTVKGTDSVLVAKWDVAAMGIDGAAAEVTQEVALFDTIKDEDGNTEEEVLAARIAPGTSGSFTYTVENSSEVKAQFKATYDVVTADVPLEFQVKIGDGAVSEWTTDITDMTDFEALDFTDSVNITINWRWAFDPDPAGSRTAADTALGLAGGEGGIAPSVTITVLIEQVN